MAIYAYVDTLPQLINQGKVVQYFATRPEGTLVFTQSTVLQTATPPGNGSMCTL